MNNIELYINQKLCDIQNPENLGVRLNRVLINPAELSSKDAQYSYSITIPSTPVNDAIFSHVNVEEVKNKFNVYHAALLYVDGVLIFDGRFKMSEIDSEGNYKGNLVLPAKKTIKEIFGEKKMNEIGEWEINLENPKTNEPYSMTEILNLYNKDKGTPECIFPLVLYNLLPKVAEDGKEKYSNKDVWDKTVRLGIQDFPPSINCMQAIKQIFESNKLSISGSAFEDVRLNKMYMSYQNPDDYALEWHWGHLGKFHIAGNWSNRRGNVNEEVFYKNESDRNVYAANLFSSSTTQITLFEDNGTNMSHILVNDLKDNTDNRKRKSDVQILIPKSGLYEINLKVKIKINDEKNERWWRNSNVQVLSGESSKKDNYFSSRDYEIKLIRDLGEGDFRMSNAGLDGQFYRPNMAQDAVWTGEQTEYFFPKPSKQCVQFIDPVQNELLLAGFMWGDAGDQTNPLLNQEEYRNQNSSRILAIKNGWSWDVKYSQKDKIYSAINSEGYKRWGILEGDDDKDTDEEYDENGNEIDGDEWLWQDSDRFKIGIENIAPNYINRYDKLSGDGELHQIVWLNKGERLTLISVSDEGHYKRSGRWSSTKKGWSRHDVEFDLSVRPFRKEVDWIKVDNTGSGFNTDADSDKMIWDSTTDFETNKMNLAQFLPSEVKVDEWLDSFCKAFNLQLTQSDDDENEFKLDTRPIASVSAEESILDLDKKTSLAKSNNQPLGLPSKYEVGFKINKDEEGYDSSDTNDDKVYKDGGGTIETGSLDGKTVKQSSNFSYNWYKEIKRPKAKEDGTDQILQVPIIANKEVWRKDIFKDYAEMQGKRYTTYAQRFWYTMNETENVGVIWKTIDNKTDLHIPKLSNSLDASESFSLDYYETHPSILTTYFNIIATDDSNFTFVECYLTPDEYDQLDGTKLLKLNSDLYYIASIDGYDPMGRNKTKLKLIRKV